MYHPSVNMFLHSQTFVGQNPSCQGTQRQKKDVDMLKIVAAVMSLDRNSGELLYRLREHKLDNGRWRDQGLQENVQCHREGKQEGKAGSSIEREAVVVRLYAREKGEGKGDERENRST